jgi:hypothetical protein
LKFHWGLGVHSHIHRGQQFEGAQGGACNQKEQKDETDLHIDFETDLWSYLRSGNGRGAGF